MIASPLVTGLEYAATQAIAAAATTRRLPAGAAIYDQASPAREVIVLSTGRARYFSMLPDGRKMLLHWLVPGDVLGTAAFLPVACTYRVSAETVRESSLLIWDRATMRWLMERYPQLCENALTVALHYLDLYIAAHAALVSETAQQRLANVLTRLADSIGRAVAEGTELQVTNEELASAANITPFTASRLLSQWGAAGAITKYRGKLVLRSPEHLFRLSA